MYIRFPSDGNASRGAIGMRFLYAAAAFSGVVGLVLLGVVALSVDSQTTSVTSIAESNNLASRFSVPTIASVPGPRPWKELAIAAMEATNTCGMDVSMKGHARLKAAMANMDSQSRALIARAETEVTEATNLRKELPGATAPLGYWDPWGISTDLPQGKLLFYREVELKHGRICMLAALGILVAEKFHPLFGGTIGDAPAVVAFRDASLKDFWKIIAVVISVIEFQSIRTFQNFAGKQVDDKWMMKEDRIPGDLGFDPLGLKPKKATELVDLQTKELNNGRLAMISVAGIIVQEMITGKKV